MNLKQWTATAGPIQTKRVSAVLSKIYNERDTTGRTSIDIDGKEYHGTQVRIHLSNRDGKPDPRPEVAEAWQALGERHAWAITRDNCRELLADAERTLAALVAVRPRIVTDYRKPATAEGMEA